MKARWLVLAMLLPWTHSLALLPGSVALSSVPPPLLRGNGRPVGCRRHIAVAASLAGADTDGSGVGRRRSPSSVRAPPNRPTAAVPEWNPWARGFRVRRALLPADLPALSKCRETAVPAGLEVRRSSLQTFVAAESLATGRADFGVVATNVRGGIIGCADVFLLGGRPSTAEVRNVFVRPDQRRKGVAEALMVETMRLVQMQDVGMLKLEVDMGNTAAVQLYTKLGLQPANPPNVLSFWLGVLFSANLRVAMSKKLVDGTP